MKRLYSAIALCVCLLLFEAAVFLPSIEAKEDVILALLQLPAPPPPNPLSPGRGASREEDFYNKSKPPPDNASIGDLMDYWQQINSSYQDLRYSPEPSDKVLARLIYEIEKKPALLPQYLNVFPKIEASGDFVKKLYDRESTSGAYDRDDRDTIKQWLTFNSQYFSSDLFRMASRADDTETYVTGHDELLALARVDYEKARPIISRLEMNPSNKASRALAAWANYRHAVETESTGDIERYRDELKAMVENKNLPGPMRDLAMDALVAEKEWAGRDEWYMSLLSDPTLADMGGYTGLTTLILVSPEEKYVERMVGLISSSDPVVRAAAIRNLLTRLRSKNPDIIRAMLPWLEDPNWAIDSNDQRRVIVDALRELEIPESVPGLIKIFDEKATRPRPSYGANAAANAAIAAANSVSRASNTVRTYSIENAPPPPPMPANRPAANAPYGTPEPEEIVFPYRSSAISALGRQGDSRALSVLRRALNEVEGWERRTVIGALLKCNGFSVVEQITAIEAAIKKISEYEQFATNSAVGSNKGYDAIKSDDETSRPLTQTGLMQLLGSQLIDTSDVSDELAAATIERIRILDEKDPNLADRFRQVVLRWPNAAVNMMMLSDVKHDKASVNAMVRLLSERKELREKQPTDVFDLRTGTPASVGIAACMLEDPGEYAAILDGDNIETKISLLACARLVRAPLAVEKVADYVRSSDKRLALAAERFLESEDSIEARSIFLSLHPNEARITGARAAFFVDGGTRGFDEYLYKLFESVNSDSGYGSGLYDQDDSKEREAKFVSEITKDDDLLALYSYQDNIIRIYKDRVMFAWDHDGSRFRERPISKFEYDSLRALLTEHNVDGLKPFLSCPKREYCESKELLMLGRIGGRRVYSAATPEPDLFVDLEKYFTDMQAVKGAVTYELSKEMPGLEMLLVDENLHAETVWKSGDDLRVAVSDLPTRKKVKDEIEKAVEKAVLAAGPDSDEISPYEIREKLKDKRRYEGYSWRRVISGADGGASEQPSGFEIIPLRDQHAVQPTEEQWKARALGVEIRSDPEGLFKFARGKLVRIQQGYYSNPIMTSNGRWAVVYRYDEDSDTSLVRVDLVNNRQYPVPTDEYMTFYPYAFVSTLNKILIAAETEDYHGEYDDYEIEDDDTIGGDPRADEMMLLDPTTGKLQPIAGEFRPLAQQTYRPLQTTGKANEYWAAIADFEKNETQVGIYDTKVFGFKPILRVPKMTFNSMNMWVDEAENGVYFVYRGHLLKLPLKR